MKCNFCGNEVEKDAKFCPVCGTKIMQENDDTDSLQSREQLEEPGKQSGYGYGDSDYSQGSFGQSENNQSGYGYGQLDGSQGGYSYDQPDGSQGGYSYGQPENNQGGYSYGQSDNAQRGYGYGQQDVSQEGQNYGQSDSRQGGYNYGQENNYNQSNYGQPDNGYGQPGNDYSQPYYGQSNYGQPTEQISGTPYLIFAILTTICCCLPIGIVSIVYASKIDSLQRMGDYSGAQNAAKKAKIFSIVGAITGVIAAVVLGMTGAYDVIEDMNSELGSTSIVSAPTEDEIDEAEENDKEDASAAPAKVSEDLGDSWKSYTVQINDVVLAFPCSIAEVEATGLMLDTENTPEDYMINKDDYDWVFFEDSDYHALMFVMCNNTEEAKAIKDCTVNGVSVNDYDVEDGSITVIYPGGIQIGTDFETVIEKWGEPDDIYEGNYSDVYYWYDQESFNYCVVDIDPETDKVISIDLEGKELK